MKINAKLWITAYLVLCLGALAAVAAVVVKVDPFFHYHAPRTDVYYYELFNERSQNNGITRHFDYDALITGSSVTENFKTSEMDEIFGTNSIKVSYFGAYYKEVNDNIRVALENNPKLKTIVRGLDMNYFILDKDDMHDEQGTFPTYLYDDNLFNDVNYVLNRDVVFNRVYPMLTENDQEGFVPGIASFDDYGFWMSGYSCGIHYIRPDGVPVKGAGEPVHLTQEEEDILMENIRQNVTALPAEYPDVTFYYFFTPYSSIWWQSKVEEGTIYQQLEAEKLVIEELLKYDNIKLYSFNLLTDYTTDLNNYVDTVHYASWINTLILRYMYDGKCLLTEENYEEYLASELEFYTSYDFSLVNEQVDYENDYYAEALLNEEIKGVEPLEVSEVTPLPDGGFEVLIEDVSAYDYLVFDARNTQEGQMEVCLYDGEGELLDVYTAEEGKLDGEWHQYLEDVSHVAGSVRLVFNGEYAPEDENGEEKASAVDFRGIVFY